MPLSGESSASARKCSGVLAGFPSVSRPQAHAGPAQLRGGSDELLGLLVAGRWRPAAWAGMLAAASRRSLEAGVRRPVGAGQIVVLHIAVARRSGRSLWPACAAAMALTHLGLLGSRRSLGAADVISLVRANLPALGPTRTAWLPVLALASDLADGAVARRCGTAGVFGGYADAFADAAFWTWYTRGDDEPLVRAAGVVAWAAPVAVVSAVSFRRGRVVDAPRSRFLRPAAALQWILTLRAVLGRSAQ